MKASQSTQTKHTILTRQRIAELRVMCQQDPQSVARHRSVVDEFLKAGLTGEALPLLRRLVALCPEDSQSVDRLADILIVREEHREALDLLRRSAQAASDDADRSIALGVAACRAKEYATARDAFQCALELSPDRYEICNDLAVVYGLLHETQHAEECHRRCLSLNPKYAKGRRNAFQFFWRSGSYEAGRSVVEDVITAAGPDAELTDWLKKFSDPSSAQRDSERTVVTRIAAPNDRAPLLTGRNIAFVATSDTFLKPIIQHLSQHNTVRTLCPRSTDEISDILRWADLTWYEWCDAAVIQGSQLRKKGKAVCRLHSYEAFTDMPGQVNWRNIDRVILVNPSVGEVLDGRNISTSPRTVVYNGIDPDRFPLVDRTERKRKVASVGYINYKKNPSLLLQTLNHLHRWDPRFELHIAGSHQDPRIQVYFDHMVARLDIPVVFHGWVDDMPSFYSQMDYVISTSLFESFHYSIAEGMLSGCVPLVHRWPGAAGLYPERTLFDTPAEAQQLVAYFDTTDAVQTARDHRQFIIERYNWTDRFREIEQVLHDVLVGEPCVEQSALPLSVQ